MEQLDCEVSGSEGAGVRPGHGAHIGNLQCGGVHTGRSHARAMQGSLCVQRTSGSSRGAGCADCPALRGKMGVLCACLQACRASAKACRHGPR